MSLIIKGHGLIWGVTFVLSALEVCAEPAPPPAAPPSRSTAPAQERPTRRAASDAERLAELRRLLKGERTELAFGQIMRLFSTWPRGEPRQRALVEAMEGLEAWPDATRTTLGSPFQDDDGEVGDHAALVRHVVIYRLEQHGDRMIRLVTSSPWLAKATRFSIIRCELHPGPLARTPYLTALTHLRISRTVLLDDELKELFASQPLAGLTHLALNDVALHRGRLAWLLKARFAARLRELTMVWAGLGDEEAAAIAAATWMDGLELLDVRHNHFSPHGRALLRGAPHLQNTRIVF